MKKHTFTQSVAIIATMLFSCTVMSVHAQTGYFGSYFTHTATAANSSANYSTIDNAILNNNPSANFLITPMYDPNWVYSNFNCGTSYYDPDGKWRVFGDDNSVTINANSVYHIIVPTLNGTSFTHDITVANCTDNWTAIDNAATNNNPSALLFIKQNNYLYNHPTTAGVWYNSSINQWVIFDEDATTPLYQYSDYLVFVTPPSSNAFTHTTTITNTTTNITSIDNPATNNNPNATLIVTQVYNGVYNDAPVGVTYYAPYWSIFNENTATMPIGATFNVMVATESSASINETTQHQYSFSPNPAIDKITISNPENNILNVQISDLSGRVLQSYHDCIKQIDVSALSRGIYFLIINGESFKFAKQ